MGLKRRGKGGGGGAGATQSVRGNYKTLFKKYIPGMYARCQREGHARVAMSRPPSRIPTFFNSSLIKIFFRVVQIVVTSQ